MEIKAHTGENEDKKEDSGDNRKCINEESRAAKNVKKSMMKDYPDEEKCKK